MAYRIRRVEYFHTTVVDQPGESYKVLSALAGLGVNLLAFTAVPVGPDTTQLTLFPEDPSKMKSEAQKAGMALEGVQRQAIRKWGVYEDLSMRSILRSEWESRRIR